jgi:hypothetical protein
MLSTIFSFAHLLTNVMKHAQAIGCGDSRYTVRVLGAAASPTGTVSCNCNCKNPSSIHNTTIPHPSQATPSHPGSTRSKRSSSVESQTLSTWLLQCDRYCSISNHPGPLIGSPGNLHLIPGLVGGWKLVKGSRTQGV